MIWSLLRLLLCSRGQDLGDHILTILLFLKIRIEFSITAWKSNRFQKRNVFFSLDIQKDYLPQIFNDSQFWRCVLRISQKMANPLLKGLLFLKEEILGHNPIIQDDWVLVGLTVQLSEREALQFTLQPVEVMWKQKDIWTSLLLFCPCTPLLFPLLSCHQSSFLFHQIDTFFFLLPPLFPLLL